MHFPAPFLFVAAAVLAFQPDEDHPVENFVDTMVSRVAACAPSHSHSVRTMHQASHCAHEDDMGMCKCGVTRMVRRNCATLHHLGRLISRAMLRAHCRAEP